MFITLTPGSSDFQMPNLDAMGNILQTLKDNGMMDQFQEKFTQMFVKEKLGDTAAAAGAEASSASENGVGEDSDDDNYNADQSFDIFDFIRSRNYDR